MIFELCLFFMHLTGKVSNRICGVRHLQEAHGLFGELHLLGRTGVTAYLLSRLVACDRHDLTVGATRFGKAASGGFA